MTIENKFVGITHCHGGGQRAKQETTDVFSCFFRRQITSPFSLTATTEVSVLFPGPIKPNWCPYVRLIFLPALFTLCYKFSMGGREQEYLRSGRLGGSVG